MSDYMLH